MSYLLVRPVKIISQSISK